MGNIFLQHVIDQCRNTSLIEWLAFLFGVLQVILALKNKLINFYAGIISVILYVYVFYSFQLYAESLLNLYYLIVSIAGLFLWQEDRKLLITRSNARDWVIASGIAIASFILLYVVLKTYTSSTVPVLDAFVAAMAWSGTWLMMKRKLENWIVLNISNAVAIPLQYYKGLELTSLLTIIYFVIAIKGYVEWRRQLVLTQAS